MSTYVMHQELDERLRVLENLQRESVGGHTPSVCGVCYSVFDKKGCPCGRAEWTPLTLAIIKLQLALHGWPPPGQVRRRQDRRIKL